MGRLRKVLWRRVPSHPLCPAGHLPRKGGDQMSLRLSPIANTAERGPPQSLPHVQSSDRAVTSPSFISGT
ncbi:hypothetical protein EJ071_04190 [Mesorhizobium sp. M1B.F.Ca.ET.045.04.1.1]|nr:hypothetical protein EJ071_04190 [Mesorhizobium sp. M1B.F.Ca.ET.045.04.1.1]